MIEQLDGASVRRLGPYVTVGRLGAGGMGEVHLARLDLGPVPEPGPGAVPGGRVVLAAVKTIRADIEADADFRVRFRREAEAARSVRSPYTAELLSAAPDDDPPWLATEYVAGPSLADAVARSGPLPVAAVRALGADLARALRAIHGARILHRDLKPANVLLAADGPKVIDFGIARAFDGTALTATGLVVGSPGFMSPEHLVGGEAVGTASDVFALGAVIAYAASGRGPFDDEELVAVLHRIAQGDARLDGVPGELLPVVRACLAQAPADRPTTDEVLRMLDEAAASPRPGAVLGRRPGAFPWSAAVADLIAAHEDATRRCVENAPPPAAPVPVAPPGTAPGAAAAAPRRRSRAFRVGAAVAAGLVVGPLTAVLLNVLGPDRADDGGPSAAPTPSPGSPAPEPDGVEAVSASTRFGAHTLAYPEPGTAGSRRPDGWKPWDVTTDAALHGCVATVGHLVCSGPEGVEARRTADGTLMWKHPLALRPGEPAMVPAVSGDERVYLPEGSDVLVAGLDDGRPVARWAGPAGFLPEMAVATEGVVYIGYQGKGGVGFAAQMLFRAYRESDGTMLWEKSLDSAYPASLTLAGGVLNVQGAGADSWQLDPATGRVAAESELCADTVGPNGDLYCSAQDGGTRILARGTLKEVRTVPGYPLAVNGDGIAVSLTENTAGADLMAVDVTTGEVLWTRAAPEGMPSNVGTGNVLLVGDAALVLLPDRVVSLSLDDGGVRGVRETADIWTEDRYTPPRSLVVGDVLMLVEGERAVSVALP